MSCRLELAIWSRDTGQQIPCFDRCQLIITWMSNISKKCTVNQGCMSLLAIIWSMAAMLRIARLRCGTVAVVRKRPRSSNTAAHDNHEKIDSWVSFSLYGYGAPLGGPSGRRSPAMTKFMINNRTDAWKTDVNLLNRRHDANLSSNSKMEMKSRNASILSSSLKSQCNFAV